MCRFYRCPLILLGGSENGSIWDRTRRAERRRYPLRQNRRAHSRVRFSSIAADRTAAPVARSAYPNLYNRIGASEASSSAAIAQLKIRSLRGSRNAFRIAAPKAAQVETEGVLTAPKMAARVSTLSASCALE